MSRPLLKEGSPITLEKMLRNARVLIDRDDYNKEVVGFWFQVVLLKIWMTINNWNL